MALTYNPKDASKCLPEGEYDAVLFNVVEQISKTSGNEMEVWHVDVYDAAGTKHELQDYVTAKAAFKIAALARAFGQSEAFEAGRFQAESVKGKRLRVALKIEKSDQYGDQNKISKYLPSLTANRTPGKFPVNNPNPRQAPSSKPVPPYEGQEAQFQESDIPF